MIYKKYYKKKTYKIIRRKEFLPEVQKILPEHWIAGWTTIDLRRNKFIIEDYMTSMKKIFGSKEKVKWYQRIYNKICWNVRYRLKISFRSNTKTINTELISNRAIVALTKKNSESHIKADIRYKLLYGLIDSRGFPQPTFLMDDFGYDENIPGLMHHIGLHDEANEIWDIWMKSKMTDKERRKFRKACRKQLISMVEIKND